MTNGTDGTAPGGRPSLITRLEQRFLILTSTVTLRALGVVAAIGAVAAVAAFVWFSLPAHRPSEPAPVAAPTLPAKPALTAEELARGPERAEPAAEPQPASAQAAQATEPAAATPAQPRPRTPLEVELERYRPLAASLAVPFENETRPTCVQRQYWGNGCARWENTVVRRGMTEFLRQVVFLDGQPDAVQVALLRQAEKLYAAIEGRPATGTDLFALAGPEGFRTFVASYLEPARDMVQGFRRIERSTPRAMPEDQRLRLVEDLYPAVAGAVGGMREAGPPERRAGVQKALAILQRKEAARARQATSALAEHERAVGAREAQIARDRLEYERKVEASAEKRRAAGLAFLGGIGCITLLGILLALLAIERHLRAMRAAGPGLRAEEVPLELEAAPAFVQAPAGEGR